MSEKENLQPNGQTNGASDSTKFGGAKQQDGTQNGHGEQQMGGKLAAAKGKLTDNAQKRKDEKDPPGGYDSTDLPTARDGYTVKFTFHRAENLPLSDINSRSSDPYIHATLTSQLPKRHKEDPDLSLRTPTIHKNVNPVWNTEWIVAGIPSSGFRLKCRLYDEDPSDHDDRLGNVTVNVSQIGPNWQGMKNENFAIKKRMGSKRAYMIRGCAAMLSTKQHMNGHLYLSAEVLGESDPPHGRMYTVGLTSWIKHYSPMIGRLAGTKAPGVSSDQKDEGERNGKGQVEKYE